MNHPLHSSVLPRERERERETEAVGKGVISHPQLPKKKKKRERQENLLFKNKISLLDYH